MPGDMPDGHSGPRQGAVCGAGGFSPAHPADFLGGEPACRPTPLPVGKALLSGLTNEEVRALYAGGLPRLTEQTITDVETLLAQLEAVRRGELAMEREESTDQLACWAAPLRRKGTVFAALSISVPLFRCREEKIELGPPQSPDCPGGDRKAGRNAKLWLV